MRELALVEALREAYIQEMQRDEKVIMVGQDIQGGIFPHTQNLVDIVGADRMIETPIAESGMFGLAFGAAQEGYRPIVDFMFGSLSYVTFSEAAVSTGEHYFLHGGKQPVPLVMTAGVGAGGRLANDHSMPVHGTYLHSSWD